MLSAVRIAAPEAVAAIAGKSLKGAYVKGQAQKSASSRGAHGDLFLGSAG